MFSGKRKHYVDTQTVRVVPDEQVPPGVTPALIEAIFRGESLAGALINYTTSSGFLKFRRYFKYAEGGNYYYGLPDARVLESGAGLSIAQPIIEGIVGGPVTMEYFHFRPLNNHHMAMTHLNDNLGYDEVSNEITSLSATKGFPVYLTKTVVIHNVSTDPERAFDVNGLGQWGRSSQAGFNPNRPFNISTAWQNRITDQEVRFSQAEPEGVEIHYSWEDDTDPLNPVIHDEFITLNLSAYDGDTEYFHAKYTYNGGADVGYWFYDVADGTYPSLDGLYGANYTNPGRFFPIVPFRREDNRITSGDPSYASSVALLDKLGLGFEDINATMHEDPDIGDIDSAVMMCAVPINSQNPIDIEYLHLFFSDRHATLPSDATQIDYTEVPTIFSRYGIAARAQQSYTMEFADADFRMFFSFDRLRKRLVRGSIGPIGTYENVLIELQPTSVFELTAAISQAIADGYVEGQKIRSIRKQISNNVYEEIEILNPKARYEIYKNKGAEGTAEDEKCLIPVDYDLANEITILRMPQLLYRSLRFVFNAHVSQHVAWYETGTFAKILTIAAVVLTIFTFNPGWQAIGAALAAGGVAAAAMALIKMIAIEILRQLVFQFVLAELIDLIGIENAFWIALAAATIGGYQAVKGNLRAIAIGNLTSINLLQLSTNLIKAAENHMRVIYNEFLHEYSEFELYKQEVIQELEEVRELTDTKKLLDPYAFVGQEPLIMLGEPPSALFYRTVHIQNIGTRTREITENFVQNALQLPTVHETIIRNQFR